MFYFMKTLLINIILACIIVASHLFGGLTIVSQDKLTGAEEELKLYENTYALIIGIDNYPALGINQQLQYAVSDAKAVAKSMRDNFRFNDVTTLFNEQASKNNVQKALSNFRNTGKEDGIFIFFAGHGYTESTPDGDLGYIIPSDGSMDEIEMYKNISMDELRNFLKPIAAKHAFVVVDACYSGTLLATRSARQSELKPDLSYFKEITQGRVRQVLTAGSKNQPVLDGGPNGHSVFTGYFLQYLEDASFYITASQLGFKVPQKVYSVARDRGHTQVPQFGNLTGEGDFVFITTQTQSLSTTGRGSYYISTDPEGAEIWIDDTEIAGITPLLVENQLAGEHTIYVEKGDYSAEIAASLEPDGMEKIKLALKLGMGKLKIITTPFEAEVYINGLLKGKTPAVIKDLKAGEYNVELKKSGYYSVTESVTVKANSTSNHDINLVSHASAKLQIQQLKTKKSVWLISGLLLSGAGVYYKYSAEKHFNEYNSTARDNASELHETIKMEDAIYPAAFGLGGVCLTRAFMYHQQEVKLKKKYQP